MFRVFCLIMIFCCSASGAVLHIGNYCKIQLSEQKRSSPSLAVSGTSGKVYYASLDVDCGPAKIMYKDSVLGVCSEYTRLEYLESGGGQYIDTGIFIRPDNINVVKIEVEFSGTYNATWNIPVGIGYPSPQPYCFVGISNNKIAYGYNEDNYTNIFLTAAQVTEFHTYSIDYSVGEIRLDGDVIKNFNQQQFSGNSSTSLYMFTWNTSGTRLEYQYPGLKIKWARIFIDNNLLRDYIPVLDSNGVPAMYDRVSGQYFYNLGTGQFKYNN